MQQQDNKEPNEGYVFEITGTLTHNRQEDTMRLDVESLEGQWPFGADGPSVRVTCQCVAERVNRQEDVE